MYACVRSHPVAAAFTAYLRWRGSSRRLPYFSIISFTCRRAARCYHLPTRHAAHTSPQPSRSAWEGISGAGARRCCPSYWAAEDDQTQTLALLALNCDVGIASEVLPLNFTTFRVVRSARFVRVACAAASSAANGSADPLPATTRTAPPRAAPDGYTAVCHAAPAAQR